LFYNLFYVANLLRFKDDKFYIITYNLYHLSYVATTLSEEFNKFLIKSDCFDKKKFNFPFLDDFFKKNIVKGRIMDQDFSRKGLFWDSFEVPILVESLKKNEISIVGTDTILGFLGGLTKESFDALNEIKGRRSDKPYLILVENLGKIYKFVYESDISEKLLNMISHCWPGTVTFVFRARPDLPFFLKSKSGTVALRCPKHLKLLEVLSYFDGLFSTSANKTEDLAPKVVADIKSDIVSKVKFIIENSEPELKRIDFSLQNMSHLPSTILDCTSYDKIKILREGAYPVEKLEKLYGGKFEK